MPDTTEVKACPSSAAARPTKISVPLGIVVHVPVCDLELDDSGLEVPEDGVIAAETLPAKLLEKVLNQVNTSPEYEKQMNHLIMAAEYCHEQNEQVKIDLYPLAFVLDKVRLY